MNGGAHGRRDFPSARQPTTMELTLNYETAYICGLISHVEGRRYNIRTDLPDGMEPDIKGYVYPETIAGLFRAWKLNELHFGILNIVNRMRLLSTEQIVEISGLQPGICREIIGRSVCLGLLCENKIVFKNGNAVAIYMVDTGGIFALNEAGVPYEKLSYTSGIDERVNIYRKNSFLLQNNMLNKTVKIHFLENIIGKPIHDYDNSIILYDSNIAEKLGIKETVLNTLKAYQKPNVLTRDFKTHFL